ncbi:hypothetical protein COCNU_scaffold005970G000010 [Cocos nucifera]|nr:hypothetical protein [Cocos nucifera]
MSLSPPSKVPTLAPPSREEAGRKSKKVARRAYPQQNLGGSSDDNIDWKNASFDDWSVVKALVDRCVLPRLIKRITCTNLDQRVKDSFRAYLEISHQLMANLEMIKAEKVEASRAVEEAQGHKAEVSHLSTEVRHLQEVLKKEQISADLRVALILEEGRRKEVEMNFVEEKRFALLKLSFARQEKRLANWKRIWPEPRVKESMAGLVEKLLQPSGTTP